MFYPNFIDHLTYLHGSAGVSVIFPACLLFFFFPHTLSLSNFGFPQASKWCSVLQGKKEGRKRRERGAGREAEEERLEKKQPDPKRKEKETGHELVIHEMGRKG